jgi:HlyD family secretion protein
MDKKIQQPKYKKMLNVTVILLITSCVVSAAFMMNANGSDGKLQYVSKSDFTLAKVFTGQFDDKLRLRGRISPQTTVYLDAVAGGRVEEKLVEQGQYVEKNQPLVRLSNVSLQLDVMSREAQVTEQLNFLRNTQMTMTTNRLNLRRDLLEIDLKIGHLNRNIKQTQPLVTQGVLAQDKLQSLELDLAYYQQRKLLTTQRQFEEEEIRQVQVKQLQESAKMLQENLVFARNNLDNLLVRAPVAGFLSELNVELGESKKQGTRLGQVDLPQQYKLVANIDEFYLNQVTLDMPALIQLNNEVVEVTVAKIDSRVKQSQFTVELNLPAASKNLKRGQSLDVDLLLSTGTQNTLLLKRGAFINNTGGNWAFVVSADGLMAQRRLIELGKKNQDYYQILDGLSIGEQVITSNYSAFDKADTIEITGLKL